MTLDNLRYALILNNKMLLDRLKIYLHKHDNLPTLNGLGANTEGSLTFNGNLVNEQYAVTDEEIKAMVDQVIAELDKETGGSTDPTPPSGGGDSGGTGTDPNPSGGDSGGGTDPNQPGEGGDEPVEPNTHNFSTEWTSDETNHWHICTDEGCTEISEQGPHTYDAGVITTQPDYDNVGVRTFTCETCGHQKTEDVPQLTHAYASGWSSDEDNHWKACTDEGYSDLFTDKAAHSWNEGVVTKDPAVGVAGEKTFTCTVCGKTRIEAIDPLSEPEVPAGPVITAQPNNLNIKAKSNDEADPIMIDANNDNQDITTSFNVQGNGLTYQWKKCTVNDTIESIVEANGWINIVSGSTTNTLSIRNGQRSYFQSIKYLYCTVTDVNGNSVDTDHVTITYA